MKTLYIIRHAKSSWDNLNLSDFERPLNKRGEKDAPIMAKRLKEKRVTPDYIISSSARRALDTCHVFAKTLHYDKSKIDITRELYHADEDQILSVLQCLNEHKGDKEEIVLLFGHNPGLTIFANRFFNTNIDNLPTCGIVGGTVNALLWKDVYFGCGELTYFDFPKNNED